jgi:hypothetical protein
MQYISADKWNEFRTRFAEASAFLDRADLEGELVYLEMLQPLNGYGADRLRELQHWKAMTELIATASSLSTEEYFGRLKELEAAR